MASFCHKPSLFFKLSKLVTHKPVNGKILRRLKRLLIAYLAAIAPVFNPAAALGRGEKCLSVPLKGGRRAYRYAYPFGSINLPVNQGAQDCPVSALADAIFRGATRKAYPYPDRYQGDRKVDQGCLEVLVHVFLLVVAPLSRGRLIYFFFAAFFAGAFFTAFFTGFFGTSSPPLIH